MDNLLLHRTTAKIMAILTQFDPDKCHMIILRSITKKLKYVRLFLYILLNIYIMLQDHLYIFQKNKILMNIKALIRDPIQVFSFPRPFQINSRSIQS